MSGLDLWEFVPSPSSPSSSSSDPSLSLSAPNNRSFSPSSPSSCILIRCHCHPIDCSPFFNHTPTFSSSLSHHLISFSRLSFPMGEPNDKSHHRPDGGFRNIWASFGFESNLKTGLLMFLRDYDRKRSAVTNEVKEHLGLPWKTDINLLLKPPNNLLQATWIGHATFLLQFDQFNVLTDPVWSDRCSPLSFLGPKRFVGVPFPLEQLPPIDVVIISHNHYDHLDKQTVKALGNGPLYLVPLGLKKWFTNCGIDNVVELDWWDKHEVSISIKGGLKSLKATCTPCQHFSGRGVIDKDKTLWCSWVLEGKSKKVYFAGDTGFCTVPRDSEHLGGVPDAINGGDLSVCPVFDEIGRQFGPFDAAFIPIGAYSPRYFMSAVHSSPEDAVAIHRAVKSKQSIGMHWGTFSLTDEPILEPPLRLRKELERLGMNLSCFVTMKHGETRSW